jgi:hypothetical protein
MGLPNDGEEEEEINLPWMMMMMMMIGRCMEESGVAAAFMNGLSFATAR